MKTHSKLRSKILILSRLCLSLSAFCPGQAFLLPALHTGEPSQLSTFYRKRKFKGQIEAMGVI